MFTLPVSFLTVDKSRGTTLVVREPAMHRSIHQALLAAMLLCAVTAGRSPAVEQVIFDTDLGNDCDDAGALAVLHALADQGEVNILACMHSLKLKNNSGVPALDAINTYRLRPDILLGGCGAGVGTAGEVRSRHDVCNGLAAGFPNDAVGKRFPDAAVLYRQILATQPDGSVSIVCVGSLANLSNLLMTGPDANSPLDGRTLAAHKVKLVSLMGGRFPAGPKGECNFGLDRAATVNVCGNWPTRIVFIGSEIGESIKTGGRLSAQSPAGDPVRRAYEIYIGPAKNRNSWDLTSVLYAVRGAGDYWDDTTTGSIEVSLKDGSNSWHDTPLANQTYLKARMKPADLAAVLDELLLRPPGHGAPAAGRLWFGAAIYRASGHDATATLQVLRAGGSHGAVSVHYATVDGTARQGTDFVAASGVLTWADGEILSKPITVNLIGNAVSNGNRALTVSLDGATGGSDLGCPATATLIILDHGTDQ